jgi:ergothioneine biosynthesis protein EgtB
MSGGSAPGVRAQEAAPGDAADSEADLAARYAAVRRATESLCEPLSPEDCALQSMPEASPAKWHLAHTSWFFETFVLEGSPGYRAFSPHFRFLFNSYYNSVGDQYPRPRRGLLSRPSLSEVLAYRAHVDGRVLALLSDGEEVPAGLRDVIELGLQHEQQHQELILTDVKHLLSCNPMRPAYRSRPPAPAADPGPLRWKRFESGLRWIGHEGAGFAFDNETPRHRVFLASFELASRPVTAGEFLEFMQDGGYARSELWLSDGWQVVCARGWEAPLYWERRDGAWVSMTLSGIREVRREEPVCHVSFYEADALARWAGARLPTEAEWEVAASEARVQGNFLESGLLHPAPLAPEGAAEGPAQLYGDVWEWTGSSYAPYPGYRPPAGALGEYNAKFMSGQLVLRGGSCATPCNHVRATYRNFFPPDARWQFSGVRLARDPS